MQSLDFLESLAPLDIIDLNSFQDFIDATQIQPSDNLPICVPIGSHEGVQYFIKSSDITIPQDDGSDGTPLTEDDEVHSIWSDPEPRNLLFSGISCFEARTVLGGTTITTDLEYGFGIGRLYHKTPNASRMQDTGFYVICNAVDKSIWVAFDFEPYGETGDMYQVKPEHGNPYGQLPGDKTNIEIGAQKLFTKDWKTRRPYSLNNGDPFTSGAGQPLPTKLIAKPACVTDVINAVVAGRAEADGAKQRVQCASTVNDSAFSATASSWSRTHMIT